MAANRRWTKLDRVFFIWLCAIGLVAAAGLVAALLAHGETCGAFLLVLGTLWMFGMFRWRTLLERPRTALLPRALAERLRSRDTGHPPASRHWTRLDRVFFTWLKVMAAVGGIGAVLAMLASGRCLEAFLLAGGLMWLFGWIARPPRRPGEGVPGTSGSASSPP